jgi:hypothetical protein
LLDLAPRFRVLIATTPLANKYITMPYLTKWQSKHHSHRYFVDSETNDAACLCGNVRGSARVGNGKQKYNAKTTIYNGYAYDSGLEAKVAMELDWRLKAGDIKNWERQYPIEIRSPQGELIRPAQGRFQGDAQ